MASALRLFSTLLAPVQAFFDWLMPPQASAAGRTAPAPVAQPVLQPACMRRTARPPLRVVRLVDRGCGRSAAGRMVIAGRMADVCAELERLAALEGQPFCGPAR
ncbi:MAG TPA: hypothetical protein VHA82_23225 [Ramlibacter sp.]|uniref:hypothetical protein n=1 Tax=Ramlibacter sp. TaxID=1917967 RepID=UPI002BD0D1DB|nr:hypothetical protein [Ramlibacter sp.]HVZ46738.1 hypothetical protein [Ramlibacter sp.]